MCLAPRLLASGVEVRCGKCSRCRYNRVKDLIGRNLAESQTSLRSYSVTLTYGPDEAGNKDHMHSRNLVYEDFQKYLKRLRKNFEVRYFVAGEYGTVKGRAHWHTILHFYGSVPAFLEGEVFNAVRVPEFYPPSGTVMRAGEEYPTRVSFHERHWHHGLSYWADATVDDIAYVAKYYLKKENDDRALSYVNRSKYPPLGTEFFKRYAAQYVAAGIAPPDPTYFFHEVRKGAPAGQPRGDPVRYLMEGAVRRDFALEFDRLWRETYGTPLPPTPPLLQEDRVQQVPDDDLLPKLGWLQEELAKHAPPDLSLHAEFKPAPGPTWRIFPSRKPPGGVPFEFDEKTRHHVAVVSDGRRLYWSYDEDGRRAWVPAIVSRLEAQKRRSAADLRSADASDPEVYRQRSQTPRALPAKVRRRIKRSRK